MFNPELYSSRRDNLRKLMNSGLLLFSGNNDAAFNYPGNTYNFRQDSSFLYFFGPGMRCWNRGFCGRCSGSIV